MVFYWFGKRFLISDDMKIFGFDKVNDDETIKNVKYFPTFCDW